MHSAPPPRKFTVVDTSTGFVVAFVSVYGDLIAITEHSTPDSARAQCMRLVQQQRVAAFLLAANTQAQGPRCARPLRWFPPDEFA